MEEITAILVFIWIGFGDRMLNAKNSRRKRILFFFLFYIPIAWVLVWAASAAYDLIGLLFSVLLYILMVFLLFFLGLRAWFGSKEKEKEAFTKLLWRIIRFWTKYKNRIMNRKNKLSARIFFFVLLFLPFYVIPGVIMLIMRSIVTIILPFVFAIAFLTVVGAIVVFCGKKE